MDKIIVAMTAFGCGLILGAALWGCPLHAFDNNPDQRRLGEGNWWEYQQLRDRQQEQQYRYEQQRRNPC